MDEVRTFASPPASPQGRGEAFGAANASEIGDTYDRYVELFDAVATRPVALRPLGEEALAAIGAYSAPAAEEITAIAHGAGLEPWQIGALNARTEILARLGTSTAAGSPAKECSTVVDLRNAPSPALTVQTWDWRESFADNWLVWTIEYPDGRVVHTVTEYGILAKIGVSSRGLGVHMNLLQHARDGGPMGTPVHILARAVLEGADDPGAAVALLAHAETSASTVLTIIGASSNGTAAIGAELSPAGPRYVLPDPAGLYLHTNHFLDPHLAADDLAPRLGPDSYLRLDVLRRGLHDTSVADMSELTQLMADHSAGAGSVCCHADPEAALPDQWSTLATISLDVHAGALSVRAGGPCDHNVGWHTSHAASTASVG